MAQNNTQYAIDPARSSGTSPPQDDTEGQALNALLEDFARFCARRYLDGSLDAVATLEESDHDD